MGMKRVLIKGLLTLLVVGGAAPFVLPMHDGRPLLDWRTIRMPELPDVPLPELGREEQASAPVVVYRWRGEDGILQFGSQPPEGVTYEVVKVGPINVMEPPPVSESAPAKRTESKVRDTAMPMPYSPERIGEVMDQAREARDLMEQRNRALEGL